MEDTKQNIQLINVIKDLVHAGLGTHPKSRDSVKTYFAIVDFLDGLTEEKAEEKIEA